MQVIESVDCMYMKNISGGMLVATKNSSYYVNLSLTGCLSFHL